MQIIRKIKFSQIFYFPFYLQMILNFNPLKSFSTQNHPDSTIYILPEGTCETKSHRILQNHKNLFTQPSAQSLVFPYPSNYSSWIIVKQIIPNEEPIFHLYYESLKKRLLSAQKQANNIGCNFMISRKEKPKKDEFFVAKLRGNFRNSQFFVYDNGQNPKKKCTHNRKQLAYLRLNDESIFGQSDEQKMQILVPSVDEGRQGNPLKIRPKELIPNDQKQNLLLEEYKKKSSKVINLFEKQCNDSLNQQQVRSSYFTTFDEKVKKLNVKFQMNNAQSKSPVLSLFSRSKNTFTLNFGYPLNMVQSFGIALALIQRASS